MHVTSRIALPALVMTLLLPASAAVAGDFTVDAAHSSVMFSVRHLLSRTKGKFEKFEGTVTMDPEKRDAVKVSGSIEVASLDTGEADRDKHLRSADFFDAEKYPKITFEAAELTDVNADRTKGKLAGSLTLHGVTKPIVIDVEWFGVQTDPWGNKKAGFAGTTTINRKDYGIVWNKSLDSGGVLIGEEVEIEIEVEAFVKDQAAG